VQVAPIKPMLKAPKTNHLKLKCDELLSRFAFESNLRRYSLAQCTQSPEVEPGRCARHVIQRASNPGFLT